MIDPIHSIMLHDREENAMTTKSRAVCPNRISMHSMLTAQEREPFLGWNWPLIGALAYTAAVWIAAIAFFNWVRG